MTNISKIWNRTFLGRTLKNDRPFGISLIFVIAIYLGIHIVKLEVFPFYMFAMYSQPEEPKDLYTIVNIHAPEILIDDSGNVQPKQLHTDYRSYTYLTNTLNQYDGIITNDMIHPESKVYDKFISRLGLSGTSIDKELGQPYKYNRKALDNSLNQWLNRKEINKPNGHVLIKRYFTWGLELNELQDKTEFYELGK